jgi:hypothetical protein
LQKVVGHCSAPSKTKKRRHQKHQPLDKIKDGCGTPGPVSILSGNCLRWAALRRQQREKLESKHHENCAMGKECEADHRRHKEMSVRL